MHVSLSESPGKQIRFYLSNEWCVGRCWCDSLVGHSKPRRPWLEMHGHSVLHGMSPRWSALTTKMTAGVIVTGPPSLVEDYRRGYRLVHCHSDTCTRVHRAWTGLDTFRHSQPMKLFQQWRNMIVPRSSIDRESCSIDSCVIIESRCKRGWEWQWYLSDAGVPFIVTHVR